MTMAENVELCQDVDEPHEPHSEICDLIDLENVSSHLFLRRFLVINWSADPGVFCRVSFTLTIFIGISAYNR